ncbi:CsgG/HfaB family protein [Azospirillum rugosum]|uniref:Curli production assembly/transport component CsgG n=1 Tax=Azospirillum rugosum TaxID=416170 RepID=A0ABS4SP76_9PROT|nr:CsgG/HfaB family protein [Azospirillum rugosum]MBP2294359.1 curli production assembly/transport component CsgG [Azospirillum rugosum]MDQ0527694.1 curli production assembly/transport component CsgG [Azospirillum rugosum]
MRVLRKLLLAAAGTAALTACAGGPGANRPELAFSEVPQQEYKTPSLDELQALPAPARKIAVAVYRFEDQTGQNKPNEKFSEYSRAVTQGGTAILINALERAGNRAWFKTVERSALPSLLQERQLIRVTRDQYGGNTLPPLPPLTYAGIMLEGGIIGYDSNTLTGGFGARFLGIGGNVDYRRDTVSVFLRAVSTQSGEVLKSVNVSKTIYSAGLQGGAFRYVGFKDLLEIETGLTTNEPVTLAVKSAVEKAVHSLIIEGLIDGYWQLQDMSLAQPLIEKYWQERDGVYNVKTVKATAEDIQVAPPPRQAPLTGTAGEETLAPSAPQPPAPGPTYIVPGGQNPLPGQRPVLPQTLPMTPSAAPAPDAKAPASQAVQAPAAAKFAS